MSDANGAWWYSPERGKWCSPEGVWHAHKPFLSPGTPVAWHPEHSPGEAPRQAQSTEILWGYARAQQAANSVERKAELGGKITRELFAPLFELQRQANRIWMARHTPNWLWFVTSVGFIAGGVAML